jgi:histidine kinase/DNA gyrase B/HSP90-like ATPase
VPDEGLTLRFDPLTIEHLGYKMYSHLPNALAELVANAYDADANHVWITLSGSDSGRAVVVEDDGHGMSVEDLNDKYLRIGRNRRLDGDSFSESGRRRVAGKKGLGKLALFGIGETILLTTKRSLEADELRVSLRWSEIKEAAGAVYHPQLTRRPSRPGSHGTRVELGDLRRKTPVNPRDLAASMSRLFSYPDDNFEVEVRDGRGGSWQVTRRSRLEVLDKDTEWTIPGDLPEELTNLLPDPTISGRIVAASRPVGAEHRGIALYAHGRLANEPEFFGISESSYAFSYLTGYLDVDYIDDGLRTSSPRTGDQ